MDANNENMENEDICEDMIYKASRKPIFRTRHRATLLRDVPVSKKQEYLEKVHRILPEKIPALLYSVSEETDAQDLFDKNHHALCGELISMGAGVCRIPYGVVQIWINETLMNLAVIDGAVAIEDLPIRSTRKYFHVPVEKFAMEAAARSERFYRCRNKIPKYALCLPCVPLAHDEPDIYQMDWYRHGRTQISRLWEYPEYMEFQIAVRNKIYELVSNHERNYKDPLDWLVQAYTEAGAEKSAVQGGGLSKGDP